MSKGCKHIAGIQDITPSALGCEECLKTGSRWLLRFFHFSATQRW
jgi:hypothetical protein